MSLQVGFWDRLEGKKEARDVTYISIPLKPPQISVIALFGVRSESPLLIAFLKSNQLYGAPILSIENSYSHQIMN